MDFKQTVLQEGMSIFQQYGINRLSMETILDKLDISRGTLAGIARSKAELLDQCIEVTLALRQEQFANIIEQADNAVEAILTLLRANLKAITGHHPDFLADLRSHHQPCWQKMQAFSEEYLRAYLTQLFNIGTEQQLFKAELNADILSNLLLTQTYAIIDAGLLTEPDDQFEDVFKMGFEYYLRGLVTEKGMAVLESKVREFATEMP